MKRKRGSASCRNSEILKYWILSAVVSSPTRHEHRPCAYYTDSSIPPGFTIVWRKKVISPGLHQTAVLTDPLFWQFITLSPRLFCSSVLVVSLAMRFNFLRPWFNILPALKVSTGIQQVMTWWRALIPNQAISWCSNRCQPVAPIVGSIALCSRTKHTAACLVSLPAVTVSIPHQSSMSPPA